jgi:hypothetical protein
MNALFPIGIGEMGPRVKDTFYIFMTSPPDPMGIMDRVRSDILKTGDAAT